MKTINSDNGMLSGWIGASDAIEGRYFTIYGSASMIRVLPASADHGSLWCQIYLPEFETRLSVFFPDDHGSAIGQPVPKQVLRL